MCFWGKTWVGRGLLLLLVLGPLVLGGCLYGRVKYPLDRDVARTELGEKVGTASAHSVAWLVSWGDAGTARAARDGDLQVINHLDGEYFIVLFGLYARHTTIAYGD
ncbi:MAG: TRL domain-containing protein [Desulfosudaceae bacterium]